MTSFRDPAVAGSFYPGQPEQLCEMVNGLLTKVPTSSLTTEQIHAIKALIVPHAGYIYSGPIAATAYHLLQNRSQKISRVVLLGPSHRAPLRGMALPSADSFRTPLGEIPLDKQGISQLLEQNDIAVLDQAHQYEHSLEVQLPFLQNVLDNFTLIPIVVGVCEPKTVANALQCVWGGEETLIVISSDLSHYHDYDNARELDTDTSQLINEKHWHLQGEQACGAYPINGLLKLASQRELNVRTLDLRNSGDTAGDKDRVVGYGAYALF